MSTAVMVYVLLNMLKNPLSSDYTSAQLEWCLLWRFAYETLLFPAIY